MSSSLSAPHGFTLLELIVVIALVILLFAAALENLLPLRGEAERASVLATTGSLRAAIGIESSKRVVHEGTTSLLDMDGANPIAWLAFPPANYAGELDGATFRDVPRGQWAWFPERQLLFYRVRYPEYFEGSELQPAGIRFRVEVTRSESGQPTSIRLVQLDEASWDTSGSQLGRWLEMIGD